MLHTKNIKIKTSKVRTQGQNIYMTRSDAI